MCAGQVLASSLPSLCCSFFGMLLLTSGNDLILIVVHHFACASLCLLLRESNDCSPLLTTLESYKSIAWNCLQLNCSFSLENVIPFILRVALFSEGRGDLVKNVFNDVPALQFFHCSYFKSSLEFLLVLSLLTFPDRNKVVYVED